MDAAQPAAEAAESPAFCNFAAGYKKRGQGTHPRTGDAGLAHEAAKLGHGLGRGLVAAQGLYHDPDQDLPGLPQWQECGQDGSDLHGKQLWSVPAHHSDNPCNPQRNHIRVLSTIICTSVLQALTALFVVPTQKGALEPEWP